MACRSCSSGTGCDCSVVSSADGVITFAGDGTPITSAYTPTFNDDVWLNSLTTNSSACNTLNNPKVPVLLGDGSVVKVPLPCPTAGSGTIPGDAFGFTFSTTTTDADPGDGYLRFNNATYSSVTSIFVDLTDVNSTNITAWLDSLAAGSRIRVYSKASQTNWVDFTLSSVTSATGYRKLVVTYVSSSGALSAGTIGDTVLSYSPVGAAGAAGGFNSIQTINTQTGTTYTFVIGDVGVLATFSNAGAITVTVPTNASVAFAVGTHIDAAQFGVGKVTFVGAGGVTILSAGGLLSLSAQYAGGTLVKTATNTWLLTGSLIA